MNGEKRRKRKILQENSSPNRPIFATKKEKLCMLCLSETETRMFVLQIFLCFSRHIALVWQSL